MKLDIILNGGPESREYFLTKRTLLKGSRFKNGGSEFENTSELLLSFESNNNQQLSESNIQKGISNLHVRYERTHLRKNGKRNLPNPIEHYFLKVEEPICFLDLKMSPDGKFVELLNHGEVKKKWENTRYYLDNYFVGEDSKVKDTIQGWTDLMDDTINDPSKLNELLERDFILNAVFPGYLLDYGESDHLNRERTFYEFLGKTKLVLQESLELKQSIKGWILVVRGYLDKEKTDTKCLAMYLGIKEEDVKELSFLVSGEYCFDKSGIISNMKFVVKAELLSIGFVKCVVLLIDLKE